MKENYEAPEMEVNNFSSDDAISASDYKPGGGWDF